MSEPAFTRALWSRSFALPRRRLLMLLLVVAIGMGFQSWTFAAASESGGRAFPPSLESYGDSEMTGLGEILRNRIEREPFNLWATLLFLGAIAHTFLTNRFRHQAHVLEDRHRARWVEGGGDISACPACGPARLLHFLGEVEVVFGLWAIPLIFLMAAKVGLASATDYVNHRVSYEEAVFVVVIMTIAATRPVLGLAEAALRRVAALAGGGPGAWWLAILTLGPLLGSFITEPAAMTISALLLGRQFYALQPGNRFAYATLGLLFVNVSVGGVLTHFAAPPVLMVAGPWKWGTAFMLEHFGWISVVGIVVTNALYFAAFRGEFARMAPLAARQQEAAAAAKPARPVPAWITLVHLLAIAWSVLNVHHPVLVIGGFLFFIAFCEVTQDHQSELALRPAILVGFFLGGLVIFGGLQQWWIGPLLGRLGELPLLVGAVVLTAFNDNAAITYLATLVPALNDGMKFAVVAGAVTGGGLTVIANAPNPAGQAILGRHFKDGISAGGLFLGALPATLVFGILFVVLGRVG